MSTTYLLGKADNVDGLEEGEVDHPRKLEFAENLKQVACGGNHILFLTQNGKIFSCGNNNDYGQLGTIDLNSQKTPQMVTSLENYDITQVSCGVNHSLAINEWGQIFSWGSNSQGQLGLDNSSSTNHAIPKLIKTLATMHIIQVACGKFHSLVLTKTGQLYSFGANTFGELGHGTMTEKVSKPTLISSLAGIPIAFIACGGHHSFVISKSGTIFAFGKNLYGQLGVGDTSSKAYPIQLKTMRSIGVRYISCGDDFSVFLTHDGGVFSCGNNQFGQLGHDSLTNEALPKKVVELMGSNCTQVACGKRYALVLIPSRGRIYGFGQLSNNGSIKSSSPQVIKGPWTPNDPNSSLESAEKREAVDMDDSMSEKVMVKKIFAGDEQCFVAVVEEFKKEVPDNFRDYSTDSQISFLTVALAKHCSEIEKSATLDFELISSIEVIFKSLACLNASFLLENNQHFCCTSKHNGVDLKAAEMAFDYISKIENENLKHLIWDSITNDLLSSLVSRPADVECLRIYLVLPLYHEFINSKNYQNLQTPFATSIMSVDEIPLIIIKQWYANAPIEFFERMIQVYLDVVKYFFQIELKKVRNANKQVINEPNLVLALSILSMFYLINHLDRLDGQKVPYEAFHIPDISDIFEIRQDYVQWCMDNNSAQLYLCNYPFLFDASAKMLLLQTDQALQMHSAMQTASQSLLSMFTGVPTNIYIMLNVSRDNVVEDTIRELANYGCNDLKKPLKVKFENEEGEDAGGVRKEFFMLLLREVLDPKYGMFKYYEDSRSIWFSEASFEEEEMFKLIGILCGLAIYNFTIINLPFPLALYKKLLNEKVDITDLKELSPQQAISMQAILDYQDPDLEQVFCINFEVTREFFGETKTIPLKRNGDKIAVTQENKKEFVELYIDFIFNKSVEKHFKGFYDGFNRVCDGRVMKLFKPHELMAVVIGNEEYDWEVFEQVAEYKDGYSSADPIIQWFWEVFKELSLAEKKMFLLFLTGSDRIPITGMKALKICIQPTENTLHLPVAHTCVSLLDLPRYSTKERLKYKLVQAIQQTTGFSLV